MKSLLTLFILVFFSTFSLAQIDNEVIFETNFNSNFQDNSPSQLNGEPRGEISFTKNRFGEDEAAAYFPGNKESYLFFGRPDHLKNLDEFTISLWFQGGTYALGDYESLVTLFEYYIGLYDLNTPLAVGIWDLDWNRNAYDWSNDQYFPDYDSTSWHHVVLVKTVDSSYLYRDSYLRGKQKGYSTYWDNTDSVIVGQSYKGAIDDLRIYSGALNEQEIDQLFNESDIITGTTPAILKEEETSFFPNPVKGQLNFSSPVNIQILNYQGLILFEADNVYSCDISHLNPGLYFLTINGETPTRIIKN